MKLLVWSFAACVLLLSDVRGQEGDKSATPSPSEAKSATTDQKPEDGKTESASQHEANAVPSIPPPDWIHDAIWYYLDVRRFRNGEPSNELVASPVWGLKMPHARDDEHIDCAYRADIQGLRQKLSYLKQLGINSVILNGVFSFGAVHWYERTRHVDDCIGVPPALTSKEKEWSKSDELFLEVVASAQEMGMRIVVQMPIQKSGHFRDKDGPYAHWPVSFRHLEETIWKMNERWLKNPGGTKKEQGIDGWAVVTDNVAELNVYGGWRTRIKETNPQCVLVAMNPSPGEHIVSGRDVDAFVYSYPTDFAVRLLDQRSGVQRPSITDLNSIRMTQPGCLSRFTDSIFWECWPNCLSVPLKYDQPIPAVKAADCTSPNAIERWRLALVFHLFLSNNYAIPFGEEVGMIQEGPPWYPEPMWWNDLENPESKKPTYRGDFYALIQMLNTFRARFAPLRRGDFKPLIADDEKKLLAFARTLPGDEIILVMNYGDAKQSAKLTVGRPGELVQVLSPQLKPMPMVRKGQPPPPEPDLTKIPELRVGGQREYVKPDGTIDFWVDPMGVRIVVLGESAQAKPK